MNFFMVQEFLVVLLVLAVSMATVLALVIAFMLVQEGIRRAVRWAKTGVTPLEGLHAKEQWLQRSDARSPLR